MLHHQMNFWLWAFKRDSHQFLATSQASNNAFEKIFDKSRRDRQEDQIAYDHLDKQLSFDKYHFVTTMGSLLRILKISKSIWPVLQPSYSASTHLLQEGQIIRGLIEHSEEYFAGKGKNPDKWERPDLKGLGISDASSMTIDEDGHWIGGRLNIERAMKEVAAIAIVSASIPEPDY